MANKLLIVNTDGVNPLTLTFFHVLVSCVCDCKSRKTKLSIVVNMSIFHRKELAFYYSHFNVSDIGRYVFPLSFAMMGAKYLTYKSYGMIPVSLTHTVKALQPFFNVIIVFLWTGDIVDTPTFLSLFPIILGVTYASVKEIE